MARPAINPAPRKLARSEARQRTRHERPLDAAAASSASAIAQAPCHLTARRQGRAAAISGGETIESHGFIRPASRSGRGATASERSARANRREKNGVK